VRRGVYVRAPVNPWLGSWRALGFSGIVFKAANGRYQPGGVKDDWVQMSMPPR
jgi:ATP-dependent DNA ligase